MTTNLKRLLSVILCIVLIAAVALFTIGCDGETKEIGAEETTSVQQTDVQTPEEDKKPDDVKTVGQGEKQFDFVVVDLEGNETKFVVKTDKTIVGDALLDAELISGEKGDYGLYVKTVNGITADYDKDQTYWGFFIDGEYAMTGVDSTQIEEGKIYSFKVSK